MQSKFNAIYCHIFQLDQAIRQKNWLTDYQLHCDWTFPLGIANFSVSLPWLKPERHSWRKRFFEFSYYCGAFQEFYICETLSSPSPRSVAGFCLRSLPARCSAPTSNPHGVEGADMLRRFRIFVGIGQWFLVRQPVGLGFRDRYWLLDRWNGAGKGIGGKRHRAVSCFKNINAMTACMFLHALPGRPSSDLGAVCKPCVYLVLCRFRSCALN
jgi:hypothetical protein